jgi:hypothetical protein
MFVTTIINATRFRFGFEEEAEPAVDHRFFFYVGTV